LPELKGQPLEHIIGQSFERETIFIVPLPHPSGVSRWLNLPQNQARVEAAVTELKRLRQMLVIE
jgi:hypothetical protein